MPSWCETRPCGYLAAAYFCIKMMRYLDVVLAALLFGTVLGYQGGKPAYVSIASTPAVCSESSVPGLIADKVFSRRRVGVAAVMMVLLAVALWIYASMEAQTALANVVPLVMTLGGSMASYPVS